MNGGAVIILAVWVLFVVAYVAVRTAFPDLAKGRRTVKQIKHSKEYDEQGFDEDGWSSLGFHRNGTRYDDNGFDQNGNRRPDAGHAQRQNSQNKEDE